ncbi:winged helix-turn-helix transcriptional regulator [Lentzea jiangxiensis]|uniref:DNA-binding transcriptional regulator, HxlR family n=1 Tax=Lentzea jiangxiensis TaxID=641025 RepID=A0A1H0L778_9PSEU|nr:winged helix-turn-helix transcriptional regulator [Lentzea jiangxiensis]SDO63896.1 DNA-binding transcriptional regulator, HxlR family [Lentzea jiangxiensis]
MKRRDFGQYCGLARALELVGERWALLIVRNLLVRPRRYTELQTGLAGIPTNVLATRLKELEQAGIVERRVAPAPARGVVYALTDVGCSLEPALLSLARWGATQLGEPQRGDVVTPEGLVLNLRAVFQPAEGAGLTASWEIHVRDVVVHAVLTDGDLVTGLGPAPAEPDLTITATFADDELASYRAIMTAARDGEVELKGRPALLDTFLRVFTVPRVA